MFGKNWPMISPARALEGLDGLQLDVEARDPFLAGDALRVSGLGPVATTGSAGSNAEKRS